MNESRKRKQTSLLCFIKKVREHEMEDSNVQMGVTNESKSFQCAANDLENYSAQDARMIPINDISSCSNETSNPISLLSNSGSNNYDIANFITPKNSLSSLELLEICKKIWVPETNYIFPTKAIRCKNLKFQKRWLEKWHWLCYSEKMDGAFCKYCVLFAPSEVGSHKTQAIGKLVSVPFNSWNHALESFQKHNSLGYHHQCLETYGNLKKINDNSAVSIDKILDTKKAEEISKNREILRSVIKTVIFCGKQGIAFRGHSDYGPLNTDEQPNKNEGNFRALLRFRIEAGDSSLKTHLKECGRNTYISWRIQNEIISAVNEIILSDIVKKINKSQCFSILADETTDVSGIEQLSLAVRFIHENKIHEEFLQFVPVVSTTGLDLSRTILASLESFGINLKFLRGQGYDGASTMSGELQGVQKHIKKDYPLALYVHCSSHSLNLAVSNSCKIPEIQNCMGILAKIYDFFHTPKRQNCLKNNIEEYCPEARKQKLVQMCTTRWVERHDSIIVLMELFPAVIAALEEISIWKDKYTATQASLLHTSALKSEFLISALSTSKIFAITKKLCEYLQTINIDLKKAINYANTVIASLENLRVNSNNIFNQIYKEAVAILASIEGNNTELKMPRYHSSKRSLYRNNVPAANAEEYFRRAIFLPFLNNMIEQIKDRLEKQNNILSKFSCLLGTYNEENKDFLELTQFYSIGDPDFAENEDALLSELKLFKMKMKDTAFSSAFEHYLACDDEFYPHVKKLLQILCTLPITTCTNKRSFSTLRRLKTYLRNTMKNERLNGLALLNITNFIILFLLNKLASKPRKLEFSI